MSWWIAKQIQDIKNLKEANLCIAMNVLWIWHMMGMQGS